MSIKRDLNLLAQQLNSEGIQENELLQLYDKSALENKITPCRFEYLKKFYFFYLSEDDSMQVPVSDSAFPDRDLDNMMSTGMNGDEFCHKYCIEKSVCSGTVVILHPKTNSTLPRNDLNKPSDVSVSLPDPNTYNQNFFPQWNDVFVNRTLSSGEQLFLKNALTLIETCYKDYKFSVDLLAIRLKMSVSQVNRKLNTLTGYPAGYLIRLFRLQRSAKYIMEGDKNVSEICFETGFNSLSYFCRTFKKQFGCSPSFYRKKMAEKLNIMR